MTSNVLDVTDERGRQRVTFEHQDSTRHYGPFVEHRPIGDDITAFMADHAAALAATLLPDTPVTLVDAITQEIRTMAAAQNREAVIVELGLTEAQQALIWPEVSP